MKKGVKERKVMQPGDTMHSEDFHEILKNAREQMDHLGSQKNVRYYRAYLKADKRVYADEIDKQHLLRMLGEEARYMGYEVLAFTLLDSELQLLLCRHTRDGAVTGKGGNLAKALQEDYQSYYHGKRDAAIPVFREETGWKRIKKEEVLPLCDEIHELSVREKIVKDEKHFWWSSQNSYDGKYVWHFLNIWRIMSTMSDDPMEALRRFRNRHTPQS